MFSTKEELVPIDKDESLHFEDFSDESYEI